MAHVDYEARSRVDLNECGSYRYASDPSTEILMCAAGPADSEEVFLWINPKFRTPELPGDEEAELLIAESKEYHAFSAHFEISVTEAALERKAACPFHTKPNLEQWMDTAAVGRKAGLPNSLDKLAEALSLPHKKDTKGAALIKFFCEPRKKGGQFNDPKQFPDKWYQFCEYCKQDVRTERAGARKLKAFALRDAPLQTFFFDLRMNQRGIPVNVPALRNAQKIIEEVETDVGNQFRELTGLNPTQGKKFKALLNARGVPMPNLQADTVQDALDNKLFPVPAAELALLSLYQRTSYAATAKVAKMLEWACPDARMRGVLKYYGTGPGRWSAGGPQVQNAKKATPEARPWTKDAYARICRGTTVEEFTLLYDDPLEMISCCIRHFIHDPEAEMLDGDYNALQARILCWLAGQTDALDDYRKGVDRYKIMAAEIFDVPLEAVTSDQREVGKRAILGLGFQMGEDKFKFTSMEQYGLDLDIELCRRAKQAFRSLHDKISKWWYLLDGDARRAIGSPGATFGVFTVKHLAGMPYLLARLPSGRSLAYPRPLIEVQKDDAQGRDQITYWGQLPMSQQWGRIKLYGGKLAENLTMGVEADIMAHGAINAERLGMAPFALIHDQALAMANGHTPEEFSAALADVPPWAKGLPLKVESKLCKFYSK